MVLQNQKYKITITVDETYTIDSTDNQYYDIVLNPQNYHHGKFYKTFRISIEMDEIIKNIALIGDYYSYDTDCAILNDNILTILQNNTISQIDIINFHLLQSKQFDCLGCNFGIYSVSKGYIIYGEIEIIMLDFQFYKKWDFTGKDIFVSQTQKQAFVICDKIIKLYDWEDNYYEIDFNGKLIN